MKLYEIMSFKTFYYFLKDTSNLDLSNYEKYEFEKEEIEDLESRESLCDAFWDDMHGTDSLIEIKTNHGSVIFHEVDDHEYVKEFLAKNSKLAPCAFFGSYRTSNVYMFGYAENGKLKRFMYTDDGETEVVGEQTEIEKKCNLNFEKADDSPHLKEFIDDNQMFEMAQTFVPFDIENDDVEILSITQYDPIKVQDTKQNGEEKPQAPQIEKIDVERGFTHKIEFGLRNIMHLQNINTFRIFISKNKNDNNLYIASFLWWKDDLFEIYSDIVDIKNRHEFNRSIARCMNVLSCYTLGEDTGYTPSFDKCFDKAGKPDFQAVIQIDLKYTYDNNYSIFENFHYVRRNKNLVSKLYNFIFAKRIYGLSLEDSDRIYLAIKRKFK